MVDGKQKASNVIRWRMFWWSVIVTIAATLFAAVVYGGYRVYPYLRPAPITDENAEAMMEAYEKLASAIENRPAADREAFEKLFEQWKERFETVKDRTPDFKECPTLPEDFGPETEPFLAEFSKFSAAVAGIVDDGFVWKQEFSFDAEIMLFAPVRQWIYWEIAIAYLETKSGESKEAIIRVNRVKKVVTTLYETPILIHTMIAVSMESIMYRGMAAMVPHLDEEELNQMASSFQDQANVVGSLKTAIKLDAVWFSKLLEQMKREPYPDEDVIRQLTDIKIPKPLRSLMKNSFLKVLSHRERNYYFALVRDSLAMMDTGKLIESSPLDEFKERGYRSLTAQLAWPNYGLLYKKTVEADARRANFVRALRREAALSLEERMTERRYPYDAENSIHIGPEMGCVKMDATH